MDIAQLPQFTPLVKDYLRAFDRTPIRDFFAVAPQAPHEQMRALLDRRLALNRSRPQEFRTTVANAIRELHIKLCDHPATAKNLERIESADTFAIVTGQQTGILGGPLYTFYKAFTAVALAKKMWKEFPEFSFVPMFWIETEDHDFEEIASTTVLDAEGQPKTVRYVPEALRANPGMKWQKQAGPMPLELEPLAEFFQELRSALPGSNFSSEVLELFQHSYRDGHTFAEAFAGILHAFFAEDGLLLVDANRRELKMLARDLFRHEIESSPELSERIIRQSEKLEEGYHAQVKPRALNLFYLNDEKERVAINEKERSDEA
ncbi:MAG TPA: bacillithiol biosynthesis BshC, partial [Candidatus Kapabacteria bacterium]